MSNETKDRTSQASAIETTPDQSTRESILELENASVTFDMDRGESRVLDSVNMSVYDQEILGVVGESGSGKSMFASALLNAVVEPGLLTGDVIYSSEEGDINLTEADDDEIRNLRWEEISMVFQGAQSSFNPTINIRKHFEETIKAHDYDMDEYMEHARDLLSSLYMDPERILNSYPHELSGGMKQRTLLALSLVLRPNVLVMDEPTAALDLLMQRSILSLINKLHDEYDLTIVFITHDLPLVAGLCDRLAVMYAFEFIEVGDSNEILQSPSHPYTRALLRAVPNLDIPLSEMQPVEGSAPDPVDVPVGCSYHPRCPLADDLCASEDPPLQSVSEGHTAACFYPEDAVDAIPIQMDSAGDPDSMDSTGEQSDDPVVTLDEVKMYFEEKNGGILDIFREPNTVHAVDDIDLDVYENDVIALVGESGCGKTTLGKIAIGAQRPTDGSVRYQGQDIWNARDQNGEVEIPFDEIRRSLQMIHQDPGSSLNPYRKVKNILEEPLKNWYKDLDSQDRERQIFNMLDYVGMSPPDDYAQRYPHQLSGGEKQRIALIRALFMNPAVILADEAVSALDVSLRIDMMDLMLQLQDEFDTSYLFVSHNLSNARYFAGRANGRIAVMYLGEIVEIGPAEEIINNPRHPYTRVLKWATTDLEAEEQIEDPPIRGIDIPDPVDPPEGCRFHTRCPEAREACKQMVPDLDETDDGEHSIACFREYDDDHPYWDSEPLGEAGNE